MLPSTSSFHLFIFIVSTREASVDRLHKVVFIVLIIFPVKNTCSSAMMCMFVYRDEANCSC